MEASWVGLHGSDPGATQNSGNSSGHGGSGFADGSDVCVVCTFIRTTSKRDSDRRRVCSKTRIQHIIQDLLQSVPNQKVILCHVNGLKRSRGWTSFQLDKHVSTRGHGDDYPSSESVRCKTSWNPFTTLCGTSYQRIQSSPVDVCSQSTCVKHGCHGQHRSNNVGATLENTIGRSERVFATRAHHRTLRIERSRNRKHVELQLGAFVCIWHVPKGKKQLGPRWNGNSVGPARILAHQRRNDGRLGRIVWCVHNTSLSRATLEHIRPATTREMFLHEVHSASLLLSQFEQVLQNGQVLGGVCGPRRTTC